MGELPRVTIYTDGACPVSGPRAKCGGWANIILWYGTETVRVGHEYPSTSGRMEIAALADGLQALTIPCDVTFYSDAEYLVSGTNTWIDRWVKRRWRTHANKPVLNQDLWNRVAASRKIHHVLGIWIKGHVGQYYTGRTIHHDYNERCDLMAVAQSMRVSKEKDDEA